MKPQDILKRKIFNSTYKPEQKQKKKKWPSSFSADKTFSPIWGEKKKSQQFGYSAFKNTFCVINMYNFFFGSPGWWKKKRVKMYVLKNTNSAIFDVVIAESSKAIPCPDK